LKAPLNQGFNEFAERLKTNINTYFSVR